MFHTNIYGPLHKEMVIVHYFASGSFHAKKLCSRLYSIEIEFYFKKSCFLSHPLGGLRGNVHPIYSSRKPCCQLPIHHYWTFCYLLSWDVISKNLPQLAFLEGGESLWVQISDGSGRHPSTTVGLRKLQWLLFCVVSKYLQCIVWFCHKARVWQDRWTDRIMTADSALA